MCTMACVGVGIKGRRSGLDHMGWLDSGHVRFVEADSTRGKHSSAIVLCEQHLTVWVHLFAI